MKKKLLAILLALAATACFGLGTTACNSNEKTDSNEQDNEQQMPDSGNSEEQGGNNDQGGYSQILQDILNNGEYNNLIAAEFNKHNSVWFNVPEFRDLPYAFLESEGYNVNDVQDSTALYYFKEDNTNLLYVSLKIKNPQDYQTNYVLTYPITDKEYKDLIMLAEGNYAQFPLFIQELAKQKSATTLSCVNITNNAQEVINQHFNHSTFLKTMGVSSCEVDITGINYDTKEICADLKEGLDEYNKKSNKCIYTYSSTLTALSRLSVSYNNVFNLIKFDTVTGITAEQLKTTKQKISYVYTPKTYTLWVLGEE